MITIEDCTAIGTITKIHGLRGNVVVQCDDYLLEDFEGEPVFLLLEGGPVPFFITPESVRTRGGSSYLLHFDDVDTEKEALRLVGSTVMIETSLIEEDEEYDEQDIYRFVGYKCVDVPTQDMGSVEDVVDYAGNIVFTIQINGKEVLLPLSDDIVLDVDDENGILYVSITEELYNLN